MKLLKPLVMIGLLAPMTMLPAQAHPTSAGEHLQQVLVHKLQPWWQPWQKYQTAWRLKHQLAQLSPQVVIRVSKKSQYLQLEDRGHVVAQFKVSTGTFNNTPEGQFQIVSRIKDPPYSGRHLGKSYYPPRHPNNPLGKVWFGLNVGHYKTGVAIGIHGTDEPQNIGKAVSAGCVRMHNEDVSLLFPYIRVGTRVIISSH